MLLRSVRVRLPHIPKSPAQGPPAFRILQCLRKPASSTSISPKPAAAPSDAAVKLQNALQTLATHGAPAQASHIQLAVRGLERERSLVRLAVYGESPDVLLRALFPDDKAAFEPISRWVTDGGSDYRALLLRYGTSQKLVALPGTPLGVLAVPVDALRTGCLEILIDPKEPSEDPLSPVYLNDADTPGARELRYPVHKAVHYAGAGGEGLARLLKTSHADSPLTLRVISLAGITENGGAEGIKVVDFENGSGIPGLKRWLMDGVVPPEGGVAPAVTSLVQEILSSARSEASNPEATKPTARHSPDVLTRAVAAWSLRAHEDLAISMDMLRAATVEWWQLLYKVDDVGTMVRYTLSERFLREAERELWFLAGRFHGAGYEGTASPPRAIEETREGVLETAVNGLQRRAQLELVRFYSTAGGGLGLAGLLWFVEAGGIYELSSIGVAAVVVGLWWMRLRWKRSRNRFWEDAREGGRVAVREGEMWCWRAVKEGTRHAQGTTITRDEALESAIQEAEKLLDRVKSKR